MNNNINLAVTKHLASSFRNALLFLCVYKALENSQIVAYFSIKEAEIKSGPIIHVFSNGGPKQEETGAFLKRMKDLSS